MWMVVREDPTGRLRYQYHSAHSFNPDDCYRFSRGCRSFPDPMYSCSPQPAYSDHHGEVEQYDNVSPDSPVPIYHQIYSAPITGSYIYSSPSTSSSEYQESSVYRDMRYVRRPSYPREVVSPVSSIPNSDSFYYYSRKEPRCPSPDYSPPLRNRVRFQLPDSPVSEGHFVSSLVGEREPRQPVDEDRHISSLEPFSLDPDPSSYPFLRTVNSYNEDPRLGSSSCGNEQTPKKSSSSSKLFKNRLFRKSGNKGSAPLPPPQSSPYTPSSVRTPSIPLSGGVTPVGTMPHTDKASSSIGSSFFKKDKGKKKGKIKIKKEDISNPTNFQHKAHVGWDQDSGFSNNVFDSDPMDESIRDIIRAAGQDPTAMSKKTMKFVYDFIDKYQAEEVTESPVAQAPYKTPPPAVPVSQPTISQWSQPTPPPPPSRLSSHPSSQPPARPPPPPPSYIVDSSNRAARPLPQVPSLPSQVDTRPAVVPPPPPPPPPVAPVYNNSSSVPPPPPPPPVLSGSSGAVPPPPPPPTSLIKDLPAPQSGRSNLLAEIQAGKKLKSVGDPAEKVGAPNARGDMMAQIRQGTQLKHVDKDEEEKRKSAAPLSDMGGLAGALAKALEERRVNLGIDDSSEEEDSDDKNEWSD